MKLKTLKINNIASIENATIDFAGGALAGQDLFLICGPTGAGKSTILDAICLALFNTTPRIDSSSSSDVVDNMVGSDNRTRVKDVLHLVRKNAVNASVELVFETEGREWTASWRVYRSGQYRQGREVSTFAKLSLSDKVKREMIKEWTLTDSDGTVTKTGVKERIVEVIKMTFEQFCKTTMLAQGDFTKFLSSTADEKAQILEKLVGTEHYAEVGKVINKTANAKKNEVEVLAKSLDNIQFLTEEEKNDHNKQIASLNSEITSIGEQRKAVERKLQWLEESEKARSEEAKARGALQVAEKALQADEARREQRVISLWDKTVDLREALATRRRCEAETTRNEAEKQRLGEEFDVAMGGMRFLMGRRDALTAEIGSLEGEISRQSRFEAMFASAGVICSTNQNLKTDEKFVADNSPRLSTFDQQLSGVQTRVASSEKQKEEAEAEIKAAEQSIDAWRKQQQEHGAETIDAEVAELNKSKTLLSETETALRLSSEARTEYEGKQAAAQQAEKELEKLAEKEEQKRQALAEAATQLKESRELYEKTKASISDHAKVLRAQLRAGDSCPVCGARIEKVLSDDSFLSALRPLEEKFHADELRQQTLTNEHAQAKAELSSGQNLAKTVAKEAETALAKWRKNAEELNGKCLALGIVAGEDIADCLATLKLQNSAKEQAIAIRQAAIRTIRKEIDKANAEIDKIRKLRIKEAENQLALLRKEAESIDRQKSQTAGAIQNARLSIERHRLTLQQLINPDWQPTDQLSYFEELKAAAEAFEKAKKSLAENRAKIQALQKELDLALSCKESIGQLFGEWTKREGLPTRELTNVSRRWADLLRDTNLLANSIKLTAEESKRAEGVIAKFEEENNETSLAEVAGLLSLSNNNLVAMRQDIDRLRTAHSNATTLHNATLQRLKELAESPLEEGETKQSLDEASSALAQKEQACAQMVGRLRNELDTDERNRQLQGKKKAELDLLRAEYAEWETLNNYLGSTGGKLFRNVAQSFILSDLLDKANAYLSNISTRYKLFCNPGTLTIMMRDAYQGNVIRPTNTLSGGESFIISLSLALGLSSMQNVDFEVDTLFIDEGFGTLSPEFLDPVIVALKRLHDVYGRRVGIISHVETLKSRIPVTIEVSKQGNTSSTVLVKLN